MQNFASDTHLFEKKTSLLVAVSGGPDSVCLLDILDFLKKKYSTALAIAHVNYQLRGKEASGEELFVRKLAERYQIPCFVKRYPKSSTKHDEESLRNFRYNFFSLLSEKNGFHAIALGHHKNDQAETLLMNLLRGSGPLGLAGMLPKHGKYIRPLLNTSKEDVLQYLASCKLSFMQDMSNTDSHYTRNRIRQELIPFLQERFNPNIISTLARSATLFSETPPTPEKPTSTCTITYSPSGANFSHLDFCTLSSLAQKTLLRDITKNLSRGTHTPTQAVLNEFRKVIIATKTHSPSMTAGPLKCTRNHDRVFLLYSLS